MLSAKACGASKLLVVSGRSSGAVCCEASAVVSCCPAGGCGVVGCSLTFLYGCEVWTCEEDSLFDRAFPAVEVYAPEAPGIHGGISGILPLTSTVSSIADSTAEMASCGNDVLCAITAE